MPRSGLERSVFVWFNSQNNRMKQIFIFSFLEVENRGTEQLGHLANRC